MYNSPWWWTGRGVNMTDRQVRVLMTPVQVGKSLCHVLTSIQTLVCVCVLMYLRGRGRWRGRIMSTPLLHCFWCRSAGLGVLASRWADISPPLRSTKSHITMTTTWDGYAHTHTLTLRVGAYQCNPSCSSGVSVQVDTHTRSCPGCSCSHAHSFHCWCCIHLHLRHHHTEH